jgi:hypothetical protein
LGIVSHGILERDQEISIRTKLNEERQLTLKDKVVRLREKVSNDEKVFEAGVKF